MQQDRRQACCCQARCRQGCCRAQGPWYVAAPPPPALSCGAETLLKTTKVRETQRERAAKSQTENVKRLKAKREVIFRRAEKYVSQYRKQAADKVRVAKVAKANGQVYVAPEAKVLFVVRIRGFAARRTLRRRSPRPQYQRHQPQAPQGAAALPPAPDQQRRAHQGQQGLAAHAAPDRALRHVRVCRAPSIPRRAFPIHRRRVTSCNSCLLCGVKSAR